jgi:hypothetical protein
VEAPVAIDSFTENVGQYCLPPSPEEDLEEAEVIVPDEKDFENEHSARMQNLRMTQFNSRYQPIVR